jgi:hypothetical protein
MRVDFSNRGIQKLDNRSLDLLLNDVPRKDVEFVKSQFDDEDRIDFDLNFYIQILVFDYNSISKLENLDRFSNLKRVIYKKKCTY